jgi:enolase
MIELDGTPNKAKLGANAILGVSLAVPRPRPTRWACRSTATWAACNANVLPVPMMNILNGGKHADNST